jgi:hypothetical protein
MDPLISEYMDINFEAILWRIISDPKTDSCIHCLDCGTHFVINDGTVFEEEILPRLFKSNKKSFE